MIRTVSKEEKERCYAFAESIIKQGDQFNRFSQSEITQIHRTYIGKLAEYVFLHLLHERGVEYDEGDMFEIFKGQENADTFDFITPQGNTIDIKTASLPFHKRIMVPMTQFHLRKDIYVGIKLNFKNVTGHPIIPFDIDNCTIHGFVNRQVLDERPVEYFGEGDCKSVLLTELNDVEQILTLFTE